jgi:hypothetical protein
MWREQEKPLDAELATWILGDGSDAVRAACAVDRAA